MATPHAKLSLNWKSCPLLDYPLHGGGLFFVILLFLGGLYYTTGSLTFLGIAVFIFFLALHNVIFCSYYNMDKKGIIIRHLGRSKFFSWDRFKRCEVFSKGIFLSPFDTFSPLDSFRGVYLYTKNASQRDAVLYLIKTYISFNK